MSYYLKKLKSIRECLDQNIGQPMYNEKQWRFIYSANCYSYALDIPVSDSKKQIWIPGSIHNENKFKKPIYSVPELLDRVYADLEYLNILFREDNRELKENEYRIALYTIATFSDWPIDFHFSRQDKDRGWSEKRNWKEKVCRIDNYEDKPISMEKYNATLKKTLILQKQKN